MRLPLVVIQQIRPVIGLPALRAPLESRLHAYLLNRVFATRLSGQRIVTDCDGFRMRKEEELRQIAQRVSQRVKLTGTQEVLGLMNPHERRIVHMAVAEEEGVTTESDGEGFMKRITILPQG